MKSDRPIRLVEMVTSDKTLGFLRGQLGYLRNKGFDVSCISSPGKLADGFEVSEGVPVYRVAMARRPAPLRDFISLLRLFVVMIKIRPDILHAGTPKAGLLGMICSSILFVPVRIYQLRGAPYMAASGLRKRLLILPEKVACMLAHRVICNSNSLRDRIVNDGICSESKIKVLAEGSSNGVDAQKRFSPENLSQGEMADIKKKYGIDDYSIVITFSGRLVRDKGVSDLIDVWRILRIEYPVAFLILVGDFEQGGAVPSCIRDELNNDSRVVVTGWIDDPAPLYAVSDLLVLPSYREGFPNAPLEAAAMGLPVVTTDAVGCIDAVQDGKTGAIVSAGDVSALHAAVKSYIDDESLRKKHGSAGREWMLRDFVPEDIWESLHAEYIQLCMAKDCC